MTIPIRLLEAVRDNPTEGALAVCAHALSEADLVIDWTQDAHATLLEATAVLLSIEEQGLVSHFVAPPDLNGPMGAVCNQLRNFLQDVQADLVGQSSAQKLENLKNRFNITLSNGFGYEFTDGDLSRIQTVINELRDLLSKEPRLDAGHKQRLMKRLEDLQRELHKKVSDLNRIYGLIGDAGVTLGKLGTDAKPFTDRIKELLGFAWKSQARAEQLPSSAENPMIGHDSEPPLLG